MTSSSYKALHDRLMAEKPDGAVHEPDGCPFCAMEEPNDMTTYTEDELRAKVDAAVKAATDERDAKITELTAAQISTETDAAVKAAVEAKDVELADLRAELDKKVLEAGNAIAERDALKAWLDDAKTAAETAQAVAARKSERLNKLKEFASFPADYLEKNADRFAAMSDEEFDARCTEYAALGIKPGVSEVPSGMPGLKAGLEGPGSNGQMSAVKELLALRRDRGHVDLSNL